MSVPAIVHSPLPERLSEAREALFSVLQHNYAVDRIDMDEFERRMEAVEAALDHSQLESIRADLFPAETIASSSQHALVKIAPDNVPANSRTLSLFGGGTLRGVFRLPQRSSYVSILGGASLDLREAEFSTLPHELHIDRKSVV